MPNKKIVIAFLFFIHSSNEILYKYVRFFKKFSNLITILDFSIFFLRNLLANIGLSERATKLDMITAEARVMAV